MDVHKLKTWPLFFQAIVSGEKTFEVRKNDRDFKVGDCLKLLEYDPVAGQYTGREYPVLVTSFLNDPAFGVKDGFCIMSIKPADGPWESSKVKCDLCGATWIAVRPVGLTVLECPNCENLGTFETLTLE